MLENIKSQIGDYGKDIRLNLGSVLSEEGSQGLSLSQVYGIALASALATRNKLVIDNILADAQKILTDNEIEAAKGAATIMAMNNIYYRFVHLVSDSEYSNLPAGLRMQIIGNPGIEKIDFELYSLAASAINGCGMCIDAHVDVVEKSGLSKSGIQSTIKIAAVINAAAQAVVANEV